MFSVFSLLFFLFLSALNSNQVNAQVVFRLPRNLALNFTQVERDDLVNEAMEAQNCYRAKSGVGPLTLDAKITEVSQNWANRLASDDSFQHNPETPYGENLFAAGGAISSGGFVIYNWYKEYKDVNYDFNRNDDQDAGHFTQVVWKSTERCGFGIAAGSKWTYVVADYDPPGNFLGQYTQNVFPPSDDNLNSCAELMAVDSIIPVKVL